MANVSPQVLRDGGVEEKGENARLQYFVGGIAIGDLVKTTLGPRGMDKILQPLPGMGGHQGSTSVTNDGATILNKVWLDNPAAKILCDVAKQQDAQCGDGTTGVVVLAAEILRNAEKLTEEKIHPQLICQGLRFAVACARKALSERVSFTSGASDRESLLNIARTTLSSKMLTYEKEHFASLAVDAVLRLKGSVDLEKIQVLKKCGGTMKDSFLSEGFILDKKIGIGMPRTLEHCKVLIANTPMDTDKIKVYGARVHVDSFEAVREIEEAEKAKMAEKVKKIVAHGCNVFINRQLIYNFPEQIFRNAGVMAIEHSDFDGTERLAAVLGASIASTFDNPDKTQLGICKSISEITIGEEKLIKFSGCQKDDACTIVLRGSNQHILDEAERSLHDALAVLSQTLVDGRVVYGGGAAEMAMADAVSSLAMSIEGKTSMAVEAVAAALRRIPVIILDNAGFDSAEIVSTLKAMHHRGEYTMGIDIEKGCTGDVKSLGIFESYKSKLSQLCSAIEAAEMIIRVDDIIRCAPRQRKGM